MRTIIHTEMSDMTKSTILLSGILMLLSYGCGESCDTNQQKEAWKKYDKAILEATKKKAEHGRQEFSDQYSSVVDNAIAQRKTDLDACHCEQARPEMSEADINESKEALRRMKTKLLINTCTSYNSGLRSVADDGTPQYKTHNGKGLILHPMYHVLSVEAFDSLRYEVKGADDSVVTKYHNVPVLDVLARYGPFALEEKYRLFYNYDGPNFLADIEEFHNNPTNWSRCGLSSSGRLKVLDICNKHQIDRSDVIDALNTARVFCGD